MSLYLTPAAIGYLTQFVMALTILGYFSTRAVSARRRHENAGQAPLLACLFACVAAVVLIFFLDAALPPSPRLYEVYLENTVIGLLVTMMIQFAYRFPRLYPERRWEARIALAVTLLYTGWEAWFAVHRGARLLQDGTVLYRPPGVDQYLFYIFSWAPVAFLRQAIAASRHERERAGLPRLAGLRTLAHLWRPHGPAARAARAFVLVFLLPVGLSVVNIWRTQSAIPPAVFQSSMSAGVLLTQFLFAMVYLGSVAEPTSFQVRLVGIALVTVLAVFGAAGWVMTPPHAAVYRPALADHQTLRFTPNAAGGYDVAQAPFRFDAELGNRLDTRPVFEGTGKAEDVAEVAFTFPFYGQTRHTLWVMNSGLVSMDAPVHYPDMEHYYAAAPAIFPLFVTLDPSSGGGIFARQDRQRLTVTWDHVPSGYHPEALFTFQLVLYADGVFDITTNGLPDILYGPNDGPFVNAWLTGASPGTPGQPPQPVRFADAPLSGGPQGLVQDHYLEFRSHVHRLLAPLAYLILVGSVLVVVGFPIAFSINLVRPLNVLLGGVKRVDAGEMDVAMPVQFYDEIGFLTQAFNRMVAQVRELVEELEARVAERTRQLAEQNVELSRRLDELQERNEELDAFAHTVAHDIKGPLALLKGYAVYLEDEYDALVDDERQEVIRALDRGADTLTNIVDELLLLASVRKANVIPEPLDMGGIVGNACRRLVDLIHESGAELILPPRWPVAMGHGSWVKEVWVNYISNGCKYGGKPPRLELGWDGPADSLVRFWLRDSGDGISPADQARLFVPFSQLDQARLKGYGLGLSIVRRIVDKLDGRAGVESEGVPGRGSLFYFALPVPPDSADPDLPVADG